MGSRAARAGAREHGPVLRGARDGGARRRPRRHSPRSSGGSCSSRARRELAPATNRDGARDRRGLALPEVLSQALNTKAIILGSGADGRREALALLRYALQVALDERQALGCPARVLQPRRHARSRRRVRGGRRAVRDGLALSRRVGNRYQELLFLTQTYGLFAVGPGTTSTSARAGLRADPRGQVGGEPAGVRLRPQPLDAGQGPAGRRRGGLTPARPVRGLRRLSRHAGAGRLRAGQGRLAPRRRRLRGCARRGARRVRSPGRHGAHARVDQGVLGRRRRGSTCPRRARAGGGVARRGRRPPAGTGDVVLPRHSARFRARLDARRREGRRSDPALRGSGRDSSASSRSRSTSPSRCSSTASG